MKYYHLILYVSFGVLPSLIWLSYYLRKDLHPEPKRTIIKIFIYGAAVTLPALLLQVFLSELMIRAQWYAPLSHAPILVDIVKWFFIIAFTEEVFKYLVVRATVFSGPDLDEPTDIMLYMVVAALGFAAMENFLYIISPVDGAPFQTVIATTITISFIRFIGATFLHTLVSALFGYFLVKAFIKDSALRRVTFTFIGLSLATLLHGLYNFSIMILSAPFNFIVPASVLFGLALFIVYDFDEVKKLKGICKL